MKIFTFPSVVCLMLVTFSDLTPAFSLIATRGRYLPLTKLSGPIEVFGRLPVCRLRWFQVIRNSIQ